MVLQWRPLLELCGGPLAAKPPAACRDAWCQVDALGEWPSPCDVPLPRRVEDLVPIFQAELEEAMDQLAVGVRPWPEGSFGMVRHLQDALGNHGTVDMMRSRLHGGRFVAVKRMPSTWVSFGPHEFQQRQPSCPERPWFDLGVLRQLNIRDYPYTCDLLGIFCDGASTYVVSSLARHGDLLGWCLQQRLPARERELLAKPVVMQILIAVRWLHELGIAHRDLSPENLLLTDVNGEMRLRIVDFGMATTSRICQGEVRGKAAYQAPEMHQEWKYDAYLADAFQLGVVIFAMIAGEQPWASTLPGVCPHFGLFAAEGRLRRQSSGERLSKELSPALPELLAGLLRVDPRERLTLGESCFYQERRASVWETEWLAQVAAALAERWPAQGPRGGQVPPMGGAV